MMSQQKAMFGPVLDKKYANFFQMLNLMPEQAATLKDLLQKKMMAGADAKMSLFDGPANDARRAGIVQQVKSEKDGYDSLIKEFLGDENYQSLQEYEKFSSSRTTINQFSEKLAGSATPLNPDQQQQLIQATAEEHDQYPWATDPNQQGAVSGGLFPRLTEEQVNQSALEREKFDHQLLDRVRPILTPEQASAFEKHQSTQREMLISSMKLAARMFAPAGQ
jgi:hypothetical protein